jgi:hypothetical protein
MNLQDVLEQVSAPEFLWIAAAAASSCTSGRSAQIVRQEFHLDEIQSAGRVFRLNAPIEIAARWDCGAWIYESEALSLIAFGDSPQAASGSFQEDFAAMWDIVGQSPDDMLTAQARKVKAHLKRIVRAVEQE